MYIAFGTSYLKKKIPNSHGTSIRSTMLILGFGLGLAAVKDLKNFCHKSNYSFEIQSEQSLIHFVFNIEF